MKHQRYKDALIKPFIYTQPSITDTTIAMLILLCIQVVMLLITKSYDSFFVIIASCIGTTAASYLLNIYHKTNTFSILPAMVQGILIGMLLPSSYPLLSVFSVSFFAMLFSKLLAGHLSHAWYNLISLTVIVFWIVGMSKFPVTSISSDMASHSNPSMLFIQSQNINILKYDSLITDFLNKHVFNFFNMTIPDGYVSMFWDNNSTIPAFRFNAITILSSIVLISIDMMTFFIPFVFLATYGLLIRFFMPVFFGGAFGQGDIILAFLTGGTLFCTLYLLQWFGTVPSTTIGKIIYSLFGGVIAFFVCGYGMSPVGMVYTILITNIISAVIQLVEENSNRSRLRQMIHRKGKTE